MRAGARLGAGAVLLAAAVLAFVLHAVLASNGDRAWQDGRPPATVTLEAGKLYHVSSRSGPTGRETGSTETGALSCSYSTEGGTERQLSVAAVAADSRILHTLGSFIAPESGAFSVRCDGFSAVYVDDAASAPFDWSGLLVLLSILLGVIGGVVVIGALMDLDPNGIRPAAAMPG